MHIFDVFFNNRRIIAPFIFEGNGHQFGFERPLSEEFKNYIIKNIRYWMNDDKACSFQWFKSFDKKLTLTENYGLLPKGIVINKKYINTFDKEIQLTEYFDRLPIIHIPLKDIYTIFYKFVYNYNYATLLLTEHCNMKCTMCFYHSEKYKQYVKKTRTNLDIISAFSFLDQIDGQNLLITASGEPLLHPNALKIINESVSRCSGHVVLGTNGISLNEKMMHDILDSGISEVNFSVDSICKDEYENIRKGGSFDKIIEIITNFRKMRDNGKYKTKISINCILFEKNLSKTEEIKDFWRGKADILSFLEERYDHLGRTKNIANFLPYKSEFCLIPFYAGPLLSPEGRIFPCCKMVASEWYINMPWLDDIKNTSVDEAMRHYMSMMVDTNSPLYMQCKTCEYWIQPFNNEEKNSLYNSYLL